MEQVKRLAIETKLKQLEQEKFPEGIRGLQYSGKNLTLLHSELLAAAHTILVTDGKLATRLRNQLDENLETLKVAIADLEVEKRKYFQDTYDLLLNARETCYPAG